MWGVEGGRGGEDGTGGGGRADVRSTTCGNELSEKFSNPNMSSTPTQEAASDGREMCRLIISTVQSKASEYRCMQSDLRALSASGGSRGLWNMSMAPPPICLDVMAEVSRSTGTCSRRAQSCSSSAFVMTEPWLDPSAGSTMFRLERCITHEQSSYTSWEGKGKGASGMRKG